MNLDVYSRKEASKSTKRIMFTQLWSKQDFSQCRHVWHNVFNAKLGHEWRMCKPPFPGYQKDVKKKLVVKYITSFESWSRYEQVEIFKFQQRLPSEWRQTYAILTLEFVIISRCAEKKQSPNSIQERERERAKFCDQQSSCFVCLFLQAPGK